MFARQPRFIQKLALLSSCLTLMGCDSFQKKDPLPGERVSYLNMVGLNLQADPTLKNTKVTLPQARKLDAFPEALANFDAAYVPISVNTQFSEDFNAKWKASLGTSMDEERFALSHPVSDGSTIYASDAVGKVSAINAQDGSIKWTMQAISDEEQSNAMPVNLGYADGKVFAATSVGSVLALDAANGQILWSVNAGAPIRVMPAVQDNLVYVSTIDGRTLALSVKDGSQVWSHQGLNDITSILGGASPIAREGLVITTYSSGEIYALKADNGAVVWSDTITTSLRSDSISSIPHIVGNPIIENNILYITSHGGKTAAFDMTSGMVTWQQDIGSVKSPLLIGHYLFLLETNNRLVCLDKHSGKIYWISAMPLDKDNKQTKWSSPIAVNDVIVMASTDGRVVRLSPQTGQVIGTTNVREPVVTQPIVAGSHLIYTLESSTLVAH